MEEAHIVISPGLTANTTQVHHRDFPEIRTQGETAQGAAQQLVNQLTRALDSALTHWRRDTIEKAISEVRAFVAKPPHA